MKKIDQDIHQAIQDLKKRLGTSLCIMGHHYQCDDVVAHCDITGDSLELARRMEDLDAKNIVFCGVHFMGETAALLAKEYQRVFLPDSSANCMMSMMANARMARSVLEELNRKFGKIVPLAYVNTLLELKDVVGEFDGAVCTSANADKMLSWALNQGNGVLFLPDQHLGRNTAQKLGLAAEDQHVLKLNSQGLTNKGELPSVRLFLWPGSCVVHGKFTREHIKRIGAENPGAKILAHPECRPEAIQLCDGAGSTSYLIKETARIAKENPGSSLIIATEENLVERLAKRHRDAISIRPLGPARCKHMAKITPQKLLSALRGIAENRAQPLRIPESLRKNSIKAITRMLNVMKIEAT